MPGTELSFMWIISFHSKNTSISYPLASKAEKTENHIGSLPGSVAQLVSVGPWILTHRDQ